MSSSKLNPFIREPNNEADMLLASSERMSRKSTRRFCCACCIVVLGVAVCLAVVLGVTLGIAAVVNYLPSDPYERAVALLTEFPVIDGHNDLAMQLRKDFRNQLSEVDLTKNGSGEFGTGWHTDIPRLRAGHVGGQFWSAYMSCSSQYKDATRAFIDQMDIIKLVVKKYPDTFMFAESTSDIESAFSQNKIASLIGVEGGHAIDSSLGTLRQLYELGARYMTLTHTCNTPWAHSSVDNGVLGLNDFGRKVVREMNRLGMLVDISHVNNYTMLDVLETSIAPVIFSHSSAYALCDVARNVPDNVLERLKVNGGIVMATFVPSFINCTEPENATLEDVADHIDHLKLVAGIDHVGIGSDFDGIDMVPEGLEDVSKYPALFAELIRRGYSDSDIAQIANKNLLRVFRAVEKVWDDSKNTFPDNTLIDPQPNETCRIDF